MNLVRTNCVKIKIKKEAHPIARSLRGGNFSHINAVAHALVRMTKKYFRLFGLAVPPKL